MPGKNCREQKDTAATPGNPGVINFEHFYLPQKPVFPSLFSLISLRVGYAVCISRIGASYYELKTCVPIGPYNGWLFPGEWSKIGHGKK
jgi:hypothetical protein